MVCAAFTEKKVNVDHDQILTFLKSRQASFNQHS